MHKDIDNLQKKQITKEELQRMMVSTEANMEVIMDTNMDGLKGEIMEALKFFLIERPP
jgi:DNA-binding Xre family transcriptional regulator